MRSFIALPLPDEMSDDLARFAARLKVGRHVDADNFHITLAFLDDQPDHVLQDVHEGLSDSVFQAVQAEFSGLQPLGGKIPSVLALSVSGVDGLQKQVKASLLRSEFQLPHRRFRAHVTLARLPRKPTIDDMSALGHALEVHGAVRFPPQSLTTLSLYSSELRPDGARYERLADYPLSG